MRHLLPSGARILEVGAGSGFQARALSSWGHEVVAVDIAGPTQGAWYPVQPFDGVRIPFDDNTFDVVFSSNVLEHVQEFDALVSEMRRVLRPGGTMVHIVPSSSWRLWTTALYYPLGALSVVRRARRDPDGTIDATGRHIRRGWWAPIQHGVAQNAWTELVSFSKRSWCRRIARTGLEVNSAFGLGIAYTGYLTGPSLSISARQLLARLVGSSTTALVVSNLP